MKGSTTMAGISALLMLVACGGGNDLPANSGTVEMAAPVVTPAGAASPALLATPAVQATPPADAQSLQAFWVRFRKAALANDAAGIAALSAPVVMQHGDLDDSPKVRLSSKQVAPVVAKILASQDGVDTQGRTQRQLLEAAVSPPKDRSATGNQYNFGDMEFTRGSMGWRLSAVYYESYK